MGTPLSPAVPCCAQLARLGSREGAVRASSRRCGVLMSARAVVRGSAWFAMLVLSTSCVGDALPDLDRLGLTRSDRGEIEIKFRPCSGEQVESVVMRRTDSRFETNGEIVWEIKSDGTSSDVLTVPIGSAPAGFSTSTPLVEEISEEDPILIRVTTDRKGVIPMSVRPNQARAEEILTRRDTYQGLGEFEKAAQAACG